jgi:hypothetical protein|tara:strand:- start:257 stop:493 length:237 start_codon:yes stop_codon:yes gene_type:complete
MALRLRLSLSSSAFRRRVSRATQVFGEIVTQDDKFLFTQSGDGIIIQQDLTTLREKLVTQDGLFLATQSGDFLERNQV